MIFLIKSSISGFVWQTAYTINTHKVLQSLRAPIGVPYLMSELYNMFDSYCA